MEKKLKLKNIRLEVMKTIESSMDDILATYLKPIEKNWQPSDFLPDTALPNFTEIFHEIQELAKELPYDFWVTLIGDTITEEALPTYEAWLMDIEGVDQEGEGNGWSKWIRGWTAEENRHGDVLNKYLYLSGKVNMRQVEISTQYLIADGFDIGTSHDPYRNFIYTSFQELATNISHRNVAKIAKKHANDLLAKMCGNIAADERRHASAYIDFVDRIFAVDPNEMMLAFADMMKKKIIMPAHFLQQSGGGHSENLFKHFSDCAQRLEVYTSLDYIDIFRSLVKKWDIATINNLQDDGQRARDYIMALPDRLSNIAHRIRIPQEQYKFSWVLDSG